MAETILTPITLWNTFDDTLPLKEVQLNTFTLNNAVYSQVYFSGRQVGLERVRIFGLYAMQKQESKGSILILPDVVDTIDGELVNHFVNLGYVIRCSTNEWNKCIYMVKTKPGILKYLII